jgi:hypothetical protein
LEHQPPVSKLLPLGAFDENLDVGKIIIRVRIDRGVEAFVTPLIIPSVSQFLQDMSLNVSLFSPYPVQAQFEPMIRRL